MTLEGVISVYNMKQEHKAYIKVEPMISCNCYISKLYAQRAQPH